jgi:hypothetical protein
VNKFSKTDLHLNKLYYIKCEYHRHQRKGLDLFEVIMLSAISIFQSSYLRFNASSRWCCSCWFSSITPIWQYLNIQTSTIEFRSRLLTSALTDFYLITHSIIALSMYVHVSKNSFHLKKLIYAKCEYLCFFTFSKKVSWCFEIIM